MNKQRKGFTLIELLVVIAIIGLLATIAFISLNSARAKARDAKRVSDVRQIQSALELYYNDQATPQYPVGAAEAGMVIDATVLDTTFIAQVPTAPQPEDGDCTADQNNYYYYAGAADPGAGALATCDGTNTLCGWYQMGFCQGSASGGIVDGCVRANPAGMTAATDTTPDADGCLL